MPILSGDIKLVASKVMDDVLEGGGAPTAVVIQDGVSNAIFPDISELDRAGGRVSLRKLHVTVQTDDRSTYMGSNIIVAEPPEDPNVSVTLFPSSGPFEVRSDATVRVEAYLAKGGEYFGYLYENHIIGQRGLQFFQRPDTPLPSVGMTLVLVEGEDTTAEKAQYVRLTTVDSETRIFYDPITGDFPALLVNVGISDSLRFSFKGSPASRSYMRSSTATKVRETLVADAGLYSGVVPLTAAASVGDFTVSGSSVFSQLVPSAQTEVPILDVRTNGLSMALVSSGVTATSLIPHEYPMTGRSRFIGSPVIPGSINLIHPYYGSAGPVVSDTAGKLICQGAQVGTIDYDNGIVAFTSDPFVNSSGYYLQVTYTPAVTPDLISDQRAIHVTAESRSLNYVFVIGNPPLPRTLSVSYLAQGRWYVLKDIGDGTLAGTSAAFGVGTVNYETGGVSVTLGALPDVGSSIVVISYSNSTSIAQSNTLLERASFYIPINSDGVISEMPGSKSFSPKNLIINWSVGGTVKNLIDASGAGTLTGNGTGTINYSAGIVYISPNPLPPPGTVFSIGAELPAELVVAPTQVVTTGSTVPLPLASPVPSQLPYAYSYI